MTIDHVAIETKDIAAGVAFYTEKFGAKVLYQDETWAFLKFSNVKLALVTPSEHPMHVAFSVNAEDLAAQAKAHGKDVDEHRDGTRGIYLADPSGNALELIHYPPGGTDYSKKIEEAGQ
jgi:catechol 2,3-dioxygenase-like lactoylglutathione lyase family enzyme